MTEAVSPFQWYYLSKVALRQSHSQVRYVGRKEGRRAGLAGLGTGGG